MNENERVPSIPSCIIDVHHHIVPPEYVKELAAAGVTASMGNRLPDWSPQKDVEVMDELNIRTGVTSITTPAANVADKRAARAIARLCNEIAGQLIRDYPGRFGAFATVPPLHDIEGSLTELEYALDTLKLDGVALMTNYNLVYLGDSAFDEVYRALNDKKAVVHIHPSDPPGVQFGVSGGMMDAPFDTTRAATNLICTGTMERYPEIKFILPHGGGTMPYLSFRIGEGVPFMWPGMRENAPKGFYEYLGRFYYDSAIVGPDVLPYLHRQVGTSQLLVGTDFSFASPPLIHKSLRGLDAYEGLGEQEKRLITCGNALALLPGLAKRLEGDVI
jgi:6-methylsalicylate decarboxylase